MLIINKLCAAGAKGGGNARPDGCRGASELCDHGIDAAAYNIRHTAPPAGMDIGNHLFFRVVQDYGLASYNFV